LQVEKFSKKKGGEKWKEESQTGGKEKYKITKRTWPKSDAIKKSEDNFRGGGPHKEKKKAQKP